ncbi:MAG: YciI family protein [Gammaproteobacteria bacterium]
MKFALLIYDDESFFDLTEAEVESVMLAHKAFTDALAEAGAIQGGEPLVHSSEAATLFADGKVQDGPFADSKEQLGGFYIIDVASQEEALKWAAKIPHASERGAVEVRAVPDYG